MASIFGIIHLVATGQGFGRHRDAVHRGGQSGCLAHPAGDAQRDREAAGRRQGGELQPHVARGGITGQQLDRGVLAAPLRAGGDELGT